MNGKPIAVIAKDIVEIATLETEKLRSRKSRSGTSGSLRLRDCQNTKIASTTRPRMIRRHTVITPVIVPQSYWWPSWMPKTRQNMPTPESATRSEEHTSELQSLMRISYAVFCLKKKNNTQE